MAANGEIRTGMAGWVYEPWRGHFYPKGLTQKSELGWASGQVRTIEINATFYANQRLSSFANWAEQSADNFVFTIKGPKFITHQLKLKNAEIPLANFFASGVLRLGEKLGPFIWQLPPNLAYDRQRIETFLALLPKTPEAAASLAGSNDGRLKDEPFTDTAGVTKVRHAIEVRHQSYANAEFIDLMRAHNVAQVIADTTDWPHRDVTADFVYLRLQGPPSEPVSTYSAADLDAWAAQFQSWSEGRTVASAPTIAPPFEDGKKRDVFGFFVSEDKLNAPLNARAVMSRLGLKGPAEA